MESVSLIPDEHDPTSLFINSGMQPIKPYFLGLIKPKKKRLCSNQRCFRTIDIDKVGNNESTLTFFFMLGSWSIGDYWKEKAVELAFDLLTNGFNIPKDRLWVTVFKVDIKKKLKAEVAEILKQQKHGGKLASQKTKLLN